MNQALFGIENSLIPWSEVASDWQNRISRAIVNHHPPESLIFPENIEHLAEIVKYTHHNNLKLLICGNGTKLSWGKLVDPVEVVVSNQKLNRIIDHAVDDLTVTAEAGLKLADLQRFLAQENQFLPIDPTYPQTATLGGIVATADTGSWRQRYGGVRDLVLGLSFVRADGAIAKGGGRVVKNVAGYDLMKLFTGAYGTLGVISEITFRTYPIPPFSTSLLISGSFNLIDSLTNSLRASALTPTAMDLLSSSIINQLGLDSTPQSSPIEKREIGLLIRFQNIPESVTAQVKQIEDLAQSLGLSLSKYCQDDEQNLWEKITEIVTPDPHSGVTCKIGILPNQTINLLQKIETTTNNQGFGIIHSNSGLGKIFLRAEKNLSSLIELREYCQNYRGFLTILESKPYLKQQFEPWGYQGSGLDLMGKIKQQFDPKNRLNPGKLS
jgi:glycolate oxidase FAD binding subunit